MLASDGGLGSPTVERCSPPVDLRAFSVHRCAAISASPLRSTPTCFGHGFHFALLDNGPEVSSRRAQFMHRKVEFSQRAGLSIELVYYPPYHSKYNRIERCWGVLEQHWNGTQLKTIEIAMRWLATMTWKGIQPIVEVTIKGYERGVRLTREAFQRVESRQGARIWVTLSSDEAWRSCKVQRARLPLLAKRRRSPG